MRDKQLQTIAYLYGRSREKLKHSPDVAVYDGYVALSDWLYNILQENSAVHCNGHLKRKYQLSMEAGSKSLEIKNYKVHNHRVFEVESRPQ
jgi:hypothetical protein